ncbi:MAG: hypothetical protein K0A98_15805, partial [Trueperaceae bacterium]|nr:hypothetical protein [Trueperaceae bacterium]
MNERTPHVDRLAAVEQVELGRFLGVDLNGLETAAAALEGSDATSSGCGCGGSCDTAAGSSGACDCGGDGSCRSDAAERGLLDGLHGETVLSRRAFFWSLSRMLAAAG